MVKNKAVLCITGHITAIILLPSIYLSSVLPDLDTGSQIISFETCAVVSEPSEISKQGGDVIIVNGYGVAQIALLRFHHPTIPNCIPPAGLLRAGQSTTLGVSEQIP